MGASYWLMQGSETGFLGLARLRRIPIKPLSKRWVIRIFWQFTEKTFPGQQQPIEARTHLIPDPESAGKRLTAPWAFPVMELIPHEEQSDCRNSVNTEIEISWIGLVQDAFEDKFRDFTEENFAYEQNQKGGSQLPELRPIWLEIGHGSDTEKRARRIS